MKATIVTGYLPILTEYPLGAGRVAEAACADYGVFTQLPRVVELAGQLYSLTGWNSDSHVAYYKTGRMGSFALVVADDKA